MNTRPISTILISRTSPFENTGTRSSNIWATNAWAHFLNCTFSSRIESIWGFGRLLLMAMTDDWVKTLTECVLGELGKRLKLQLEHQRKLKLHSLDNTSDTSWIYLKYKWWFMTKMVEMARLITPAFHSMKPFVVAQSHASRQVCFVFFVWLQITLHRSNTVQLSVSGLSKSVYESFLELRQHVVPRARTSPPTICQTN